MPINATVVRVLIASPGDTKPYRGVLREAIEDWNSDHVEQTHVVLLPVMWERDATPELGERAQGVINRQLVDNADCVIGVFWTRLGTPTSEAESGTAEEIDRLTRAGKPVMVYFSTQPAALDTIDEEQLKSLKSFERDLTTQGLLDRFDSADELRRKVSRHLTKTVHARFAAATDVNTLEAAPTHPVQQRARPVARIDREQRGNGTDYRLVVVNRGTGAAEDLTVTFATNSYDGGQPPELDADHPVSRLPPDGQVEYTLFWGMGDASQWDVVLTWREGTTEFTDTHTLRG